MAIGRDDFANQGNRVQPAVIDKASEVIRQEGAPSKSEPNTAMELIVQGLDCLSVQTIRENEQLVARVLTALTPPSDGEFACIAWIARVDTHPGPLRDPGRRLLQEPFGSRRYPGE